MNKKKNISLICHDRDRCEIVQSQLIKRQRKDGTYQIDGRRINQESNSNSRSKLEPEEKHLLMEERCDVGLIFHLQRKLKKYQTHK